VKNKHKGVPGRARGRLPSEKGRKGRGTAWGGERRRLDWGRREDKVWERRRREGNCFIKKLTRKQKEN
jgi:hypothetical protein